jgi:transposase
MTTRTKRDFAALEERRREGMRLLGRGIAQAEVARRCNVSRTTVFRWEQSRKTKRGAAWKRGRLGRPHKLTSAQKEIVRRALVEGAQAHGFINDLWTLPRVAALIEQLTGVRLHRGHVWRVLGQMGWSSQRPAKKATQRDEDEIQHWKHVTWPKLKKRP